MLNEKIKYKKTSFLVTDQIRKSYLEEVNSLIEYINTDLKNVFPFNYDWYLFTFYYPLILNYYYIINILSSTIPNETIFKHFDLFIPDMSHSKHIEREGSNLHIISMNYIIFNFLRSYMIDRETNFIENIMNKKKIKDKLTINFVNEENKITNGLYSDKGYIFHNIISYNYLLAYIQTSVFFNIFYDDTHNFKVIFDPILKIFNMKFKKVHPRIISRYGKFDKVFNNVIKFFNFVDNFDLIQNNSFILDLKNKLLNNYDKESIYVFDSIKTISTMFKNWSFILVVNSDIPFGEVDKYNKNKLRQLMMSKILINQDCPFNDIDRTLYNGVLIHKSNIDNEKEIYVSKGVKKIENKVLKYSFSKIDEENAYGFSKVYSEVFKFSFEELVLITKYGIIVFYLNIENFSTEELFLCIDSYKDKKYITSGILYNDHKSKDIKIYKERDFINEIIKVKKNIIYYNFINEKIEEINFKYCFDKNREKKFYIKINNSDYIINIKENTLDFTIK